jgi:hypothetical protein
MGVMCGVAGHAARNAGLWNEGYFFGKCRRCGQDLIRTDGGWFPVPRGYQVAWRSGIHRHAIASDFKRNLPQLPDEPRRWRLALHQMGFGVLCLPGPQLPSTHVPGEGVPERERSGGLPQVLLLAMLTALGIAGRLAVRRR